MVVVPGEENVSLCNCVVGLCSENVKMKVQFCPLLLLLLLLLLLFTAIEFSLGGSSSYTITDKTNKNKYT